MKTPTFHSYLAKQINQFINLKRLSGTDYRDQIKLLGYFDRFLVEAKIKKPFVSRHIIDLYQQSLAHLSPRYRSNRFGVVRQLCEHIAQYDPLCYVPQPMRITGYETHCPYIFTEGEIEALLSATSTLELNELLQQAFRVLLGLLYTTGIRIGEALALNLKDFDNEQGMLCIIAGKFRKDRWIPLHSSTCKVLEKYIHLRLQTGPISPHSPLFLNQCHHRLGYDAVYRIFHQLLVRCEITFSKQAGPSIHDLRHTFAVHRLQKWYSDGQDINARLPWLTTYMGHVNMASTQVYLRATATLIEQVEQRFHKHFIDNVIPLGEKP